MHVDDLLGAEDLAAEAGDAVLAEPDHRQQLALAQARHLERNLDRLHVNDVRGAYGIADAAAGAALDVDRLDHARLCSALADDNTHPGNPFRNEPIVAQLRAQPAQLARGGTGGNPGPHLVGAEARHPVDLGIADAVEGFAAEEFLQEVAVPGLAWRQAGPL